MHIKRSIVRLALLGSACLAGWQGEPVAYAHCDRLDGPVVEAARRALDTATPDPALIWARAADEPEIREALTRALAVRRLGPEARQFADRAFFETVVRVHRAGEGAPYSGLKPAGRDLEPAIAAADEALRSGSPEALVRLLTERVAAGVRARFGEALARKTFDEHDVRAGREFVESYVSFLHYAERLYEGAASGAHPADPAQPHPGGRGGTAGGSR